MRVSKKQIAADEAEAIIAVAAMFSDTNLIAEFGAEPGRARTTRHKYKQCLKEFSEGSRSSKMAWRNGATPSWP